MGTEGRVNFEPIETYPGLRFTWMRHTSDGEVWGMLEYRAGDDWKRLGSAGWWRTNKPINAALLAASMNGLIVKVKE